MSADRTAVFLLALAAAILVAPVSAQAQATIVIVNNDSAGEGFNDPTLVAPLPTNPGTTLGQQRLNAFQYAANLWGAQLSSVPVIVVQSNFDALTCTATSAVLGSAGPLSVWADFPNAPLPGTWYHNALANKLFGSDITTGANDAPEIRARFNSNLGQPNCLAGSPFYLGLDTNTPVTQVNLVAVVLHELGHGLGFSTTTSSSNGIYLAGLPSVYDHFLLDTTANLSWTQMTSAERAASAVNARKVVWTGGNVAAAAPQVLLPGTPELNVTAPASVAGTYLVGTASFGPPLASSGVNGELMPVQGGGGLACNPLSAADALAVNGKVALVARGTCTFAVKALNVQISGAIAAIIVNNAAGSPPPALGGADPNVIIPTVSITQADGNALKNVLRFRSRTRSGVQLALEANPNVLSGADPLGRVLIFTPNPVVGGSSVSHWDTIAFRNLLMEPSINSDLTHSLVPPFDLTRPMLIDIGW